MGELLIFGVCGDLVGSTIGIKSASPLVSVAGAESVEYSITDE